MQISKHKVVTIDYTLKDEQGSVIDSSAGGEPFSYIQGIGSVIPGLEQALEGRSPGESVTVSIPPEQAYGERDEALVQVVPRALFGEGQEIAPGMQFQAETESGTRIVTVVGVEEDRVTVDANHPLAGATLTFDVTVVDVREATPEELEHGHVHEAGAHG